VVRIIKANVPKNANLVIAGHSLGGMIAQQVAANSEIKSRYNVLNTVCFGSPLLAAGSREGTVRRLGDVSDPVPYLSGSLFNNTLWAIMGLNREDGGYGIRGITAHNQSYYRSDLWGKYDVTGTKYGGAKLILDLDTRTFYQSPVIDW
jgi:pimeloyl-ACP methyl ester carboxylesterase